MSKLTILALAISVACSAAHAGDSAKIVVPAGSQPPSGFQKLADYGSYAVWRGPAAGAPRGSDGIHVLVDADVLQFDRMRLDTQSSVIEPPAGFALRVPSGSALQLIQFVGPLKGQWLEQVRAAGAVPVQYIDSNGYLVWADGAARSRLAEMVEAKSVVQFSQPLPSFVKLETSLFGRLQAQTPWNAGTVRVTVQVYRHAGVETTRKALDALGLKPLGGWSPILDYDNAEFLMTLDQVRAVIEYPDVYWVGESHEDELFDEVQAQIIRGHFNAGQTGPLSEGYLPWLNAVGFPADPSVYPIVDIADDGVGNLTTNSGDPTLHVLGTTANATRVIYNQTCGPTDAIGAHGHINANIALGYDVRENATTPGARFPGAYQRGQGMNPYGRIGATRIFSGGGTFSTSACGGNYSGILQASYAAGARISSNSWGCSSCASSYEVRAQQYDTFTRDASPTTAGNQQLITVVAAGNSGSGAGTVGAPALGKNVLTVGASENQRPVDENGNWTDGCSIGPTGADNAMDVIGFSSRGPAPGNRVKPEVIAPGTHITGTRGATSLSGGACDVARPVGNTTYAASSGTSHSTPAVSGVASLVWWWIANGRGALSFDGGSPSAPTPSLMKAWLIGHPTYLTGVSANDTLPSNVQGYGMPNLETMFGTTPTWVGNEAQTLTETGQEWSWDGAVSDSAKPLRIVLAYTDAPGALGTSPQVNNLDLEVTVGGTTYKGNVFTGRWSTAGGTADNRNNYEAVFLPPGTTGAVQIKVKGFNIAGDGVPGNADLTDQDFSLVCSNCVREPTFTLDVTPTSHTVCTAQASSVPFNISTGSILGFTTPITLSATGNPAATTANFSANPVTPGGVSVLTIGNLAAAPAGTSTIAVQGIAGSQQASRSVQLSLFSAVPPTFALSAPANAATNVALAPALSWAASAQAASYRVDIATNASFASIVYTAVVQGTSHTVATALSSSTTYYWRVTAINPCGNAVSVVRTFTTIPLPGDCPVNTAAVPVYETGFEGDNSAWTSSGTGNTWAESTARANSGTKSFLAVDPVTATDQRLVSPAVTLPSGQLPLALLFWSDQTLEDRTGGCYDGVFLEISTDAGTTWTAMGGAQLQVNPYQGPLAGTNNPATGQNAWCGDPITWARHVVNLDSYAGQTVRFRYRLASDASVGRAPHGFYLDDVKVQACASTVDLIFANGFDSPTP